MRKKILFFGTLCLLFVTSEAFSQRTPMRRTIPKPKTEQPKTEQPKNETEVIKTIQVIGHPILVAPHVVTPPTANQHILISPGAKNNLLTNDPKVLNAFKSQLFIKDNKKSEFKVIDNNFKAGDNSTGKTTTKTIDGQFCSYTTLNTRLNTANFMDFTENGPPDWLKPGIIMDAVAFVRGEELIEEKYNRGPITISNTVTGLDQLIANPDSKSTINRAIIKVQSKDPKQVHGANMSYTYTEIFSADELNFKINGRYSNSFAGISTALGMTSNNSKSHHYYLVEFQQSLYSLEVDGLKKDNVFPNNPEVDLSNYVYISKVNYGRKGYFMLITEKSLEDFGAHANASANFMGHKAAIESNLEKISKSNSTQVKAFYYGGAMKSVVTDIGAKWDATDRKPLHDYIAGYSFSQAEAYPISYEMKNLDNRRVGMTNTNAQTIPTCTDSKGIKLKVTLMQLESETTQDKDQIADLTIVQHIRYEANGKVIPPSQVNLNKFKDFGSCQLGGGAGDWQGSTPLICGNSSRQIHVTVSKKINKNRTANVDNSMIFDISHQDANDVNAVFMIDTFVKEFSSTDIVLDNDPRKTKVAIHDVLGILTGIKQIEENQIFFDDAIDDTLKFDNFNGDALALRKVNEGNNIILEGPIRARNKGPSTHEKAFVWMRFEIIK